jgi:DNA-binding HxlR family transcriptional regulator
MPTTKRSYGEACACAHALDLVGERWALLVVRELLLGPKRFTDLRSGLPHASPNVLAQRLRELERDGVVRRRKLGPPVGTSVYELTEWGRDLEPVIYALARWGARSPLRLRDADISSDSVVLAIRALFDADAAGDLEASYELRFGEDSFAIAVTDGRLELSRGESREADAVIETDRTTFASVLSRAESLGSATKKGAFSVSGDATAVRRLFGAMRAPEPVPAES